MPCHLLRLFAIVVVLAALPKLPGQAPSAPATEAAAAQTEEQKAALNSLDADIARLDVLLEKIPEAPLKATTRGFIDVFKEKRNGLRKTYDQTKFDELKFEVVAEFQRLHLWFAAPRTTPLVAGDAGSNRVIFDLEPSPADPAEVKAALQAADDEIKRLEDRAGRLAPGPARETETRRLTAIKERRAGLGKSFTKAGWDAVIAALKSPVEKQSR